MSAVEYFSSAISLPGRSADVARRAESEGWTGITYTDSQNLGGDPYIAMAMAAQATTTLQLATGVTNPLTRHPATTASAISSIDVESDGRAELGIGRGDSALAYIGLAPAPVARLRTYLEMLRSYLAGDEVPMELAAEMYGHTLGDTLPLADAPSVSRIEWLARGGAERRAVPVFVVASGPKVIETAAATADRVTLALGADPARIEWGIDLARSVNPEVQIAAYVNVVVDDDVERGTALAAGSITSFARFSVMHGKVNGPVDDVQRAAMERIPEQYEMTHHFQSGNRAASLADGLASTFAIIGDAGYCRDRLAELADLGVGRFHVVGAARDGDREAAKTAHRRFVDEILDAGSEPV